MGVVWSFWGHFGVILVKLGAVGFLRELFWGYFSAFRAILVSVILTLLDCFSHFGVILII